MTLPAYIIHLERAVGRQQNVAKLCRALGPETTVISGIDGRATAPLQAPKPPRAAFPIYPFALRSAEIATFHSHRACWQRMVADGHPAALIVEDDIVLDPAFRAALELATNTLSPDRLVRFSLTERERGEVVAQGEGNLRVLRPSVIGLGMQALLVTRGAAIRLLQGSVTFDRPVDTFVQMRWLHGVDVLTVLPSGVREMSVELGGSMIHAPMTFVERLHRETLRPVYRTALALRSIAARL